MFCGCHRQAVEIGVRGGVSLCRAGHECCVGVTGRL